MKNIGKIIIPVLLVGLFGGSTVVSAKAVPVAAKAQVQASLGNCPAGQVRINSISWAGQFSGVPIPKEFKEIAKSGCVDPNAQTNPVISTPVVTQPASNIPDTLTSLTDNLASTTEATTTEATSTPQIEDLMNQIISLLRQLIALKSGVTI